MDSPSFFSFLFCFYIFARPHISNCRTYEISYVTCVIDPEGRPGLIGVIRSKLFPSTRIFIHIRPSILDPDLRPDRPGNYVTMGRRRQWPSWCLHLHAQAAAAARQPARPKAANGSGLPACTPRRRQRPVCKEPALSDVWCSKKEEGQKGYFTP